MYGIYIRYTRYVYRGDGSDAIEQRGDGQRLVEPLSGVKVFVVLSNKPRLERGEENRRGNAARQASKEEHVKVGLAGGKKDVKVTNIKQKGRLWRPSGAERKGRKS